MEHKEYFVAFFDVLGFEDKLSSPALGLDWLLDKYEKLIAVVLKNNEIHAQLKEKRLHGGFWAADGQVVISYEIRGAYASDSIIIWAQRELGGAGAFDFEKMQHVRPPVPCDSFLNVCNEIMCQSIEIGLPLRGALSMGTAYIDEGRNIFLGMPFVETARLEKGQDFIGVSPCKSFNEQPIPPHFVLPYRSHLKKMATELTGGSVLDWPRHWRDTRNTDAHETISTLFKEAGGSYLPNSVIAKYENTQRLISFSEMNSTYWSAFEDGSELVYG